MTDLDILTKLGAAVGTAWTARKLFGPSLDTIGSRLAASTDHALDNISAVVRSATRKADPDSDGGIPARAATLILDEAAWAEDELIVEYLGGMLASSRTPIGRDDTAATWAVKLRGLSTYAIRLHYLLYESFRANLAGSSIDLGSANKRRLEATMYVAHGDLERGMGFTDGEADRDRLVIHAISALNSEGLIGDWAIGPQQTVQPLTKGTWVPLPGLVVGPTLRGIELFLVAHGIHSNWPSATFCDAEMQSLEVGDLELLTGVLTPTLRSASEADKEDPEAYLNRHWQVLQSRRSRTV